MSRQAGYDYLSDRLDAVTTALLDCLDIIAEYDVHRARELRAELEQDERIFAALQWLERRRRAAQP